MSAPVPSPTWPDDTALAALETPCYLFDPQVVMDDLAALREQLGTAVVVSVKASPVLDLLVRCNGAFGDGIEIASLGELNLTIGRMSVPRFVNTPALDGGLIAAALACKATLVVDNPHQLELVRQALEQHAAHGKPVSGIILRLNAASVLGRSGAGGDCFGMDVHTAGAALARLAADSVVKVIGLHVFGGSHSFASSAAPLAARLAELVGQWRSVAAPLETVLIGVGLPGDWRERGDELDFPAYRRALRDLQGQARVLHEAGRAVFSRAGRFAVRVLATKEVEGERVVVCDGGMAHCFALAQTEQFLKQWRTPALVTMSAREEGAQTRSYKVIGNSCNRADVIGTLETTVAPAPGDILRFDHCGAYHSYSPTGFLNLRPARRYIAS